MFTSISKQPIDLGGISVQIKATCEIWGTESNFKYPPQEGHEKPRKVNASHRDHSLHSAAHTFVIYHAHIMRMQEHARNLHLTSDPFETLTKTASVSQVCSSWNTLTNARWMQCILIIPNCPLCHSIMKKNLIKTRWDCGTKLWAQCHFGWETESSRSQQVGRLRVSDVGSSLQIQLFSWG